MCPPLQYILTNDYFGKAQFVELFSSIGLSKNFTLLQGADYRYSSFNNRFFLLSSFGPFTSLFKDTSHSQSSLYSSLIYHSVKSKIKY
ncbi:MAG: hypothetical protein WKF59_08190 [Chitinophagaceae bacterium]